MKIYFYLTTDHGPEILEPDYCEHHPLGGTETAGLKLAQYFKKIGHEVEIILDAKALTAQCCDVFIAARGWHTFDREIRPGRLNYLWCQDDINQPYVTPLQAKARAERVYAQCDGLIMVSHYQAYQWLFHLHAPKGKIFVSSNGIDRRRFRINGASLLNRKRHAYYASAPFRGLDILLQAWPLVQEALGKEARLSVCSSLQTYGLPEEPKYQALYEQAQSLPGVVYLGGVGQQKVREIATTCRALAYPCHFPETGCITAMEAMASGCVVVSTAIGALPETAWRNPLISMQDQWPDLWVQELLRVMVDDDYYLDHAEANLHLSQLMGWERIARRWLMRFRADSITHQDRKERTEILAQA